MNNEAVLSYELCVLDIEHEFELISEIISWIGGRNSGLTSFFIFMVQLSDVFGSTFSFNIFSFFGDFILWLITVPLLRLIPYFRSVALHLSDVPKAPNIFLLFKGMFLACSTSGEIMVGWFALQVCPEALSRFNSIVFYFQYLIMNNISKNVIIKK